MEKIEENKKIELEKIRNRTKNELEKLEKEYALFDKFGKSLTYVAAIVIVVFYILIFLGDSFKLLAFLRSGCIFELPLKKSRNKPSKKSSKKGKDKKINKNQVGVEPKMSKNNSKNKNDKKIKANLKKAEAESIRNETEINNK